MARFIPWTGKIRSDARLPSWDFPWWSCGQDTVLPNVGGSVQPLVREPDPHRPQLKIPYATTKTAVWPKK